MRLVWTVLFIPVLSFSMRRLLGLVHFSDHACFATAQAYGVELHDLEQPLLVSQPKKREIRARGEDAGPILLIPELCTRTGKGIEEGPKQTKL